MQRLAREQRRLLGARAPWHVGDIAWGLRQHEGRESEWKIRLWVEDGRVVAWSWLQQDGRDRLEHDVAPGYLHLLDEILAEPDARAACAFEDDADGREALERHGFTEPGDPMQFLVRDLAAAPAPPPLPNGFRYRTVEAVDVPERVAIHREVWTLPGRPSRFTESSYAQVRAEWPYRETLDCFVEAPDGRFAAYCLCWPDDENRVGELEPSGSGRIPSPWVRRGDLCVRAPASARGGLSRGNRLLREPTGLCAVRVAGLPSPRVARRVPARSLIRERSPCDARLTTGTPVCG